MPSELPSELPPPAIGFHRPCASTPLYPPTDGRRRLPMAAALPRGVGKSKSSSRRAARTAVVMSGGRIETPAMARQRRAYDARCASDRRSWRDHRDGTSGAASPCKRIDPKTGLVIEVIERPDGRHDNGKAKP